MISTIEVAMNSRSLARLMAPPKDHLLQALILERCRLMSDVSRGSVGLTAAALTRWLAAIGTERAYMTVNRYCGEMESAGLLQRIAGTNEFLPTELGREALAAALAELQKSS